MTVLVTKPAVNIREELASLNEPQAISDVFGLQTALDAKQPLLAEGAFVDGDKTKLDGIEATADVTDATNVEAAGAVMDSDFTSNGFMKRTGAGTYTIDASTYLTEGSALNDISDVTITGTPADNEFLAYDTTTGAFINQTAAEAGIFEGGVVINESGDAVNFRVESDTNSNMISVSGINNEVGIGRSPNGYELDIQGSLRTSFNAYITGTLLALGNTILGTDSADDITVNGTISANGQTITPTELGYIANVTSDVQAQLDSAATTGKAIAMAMIFG